MYVYGAGNVIESTTHNANGTRASRTDRFGTTTYGSYNATGQPTRITDPFGAVIALDYDGAGQLRTRTERGVTMTTVYDALGRQQSVDYGNGAKVAFEYADPNVRRWTAIQGPTLGRVKRAFTSTGRLGSWTEPNGDEFTRLYDAAGRLSEEIDALGNSTNYGYDAAGRLEAMTDEGLAATTTFERDEAGRVTTAVDAEGNETTTSYRLGGRLEGTTNGRGFTTSFDSTPRSSSITDALTRTTVTSLTNYGLPTGASYPGGSARLSAYLGTTRLDGSQQFPTSFKDELERTRAYDYDSRSGLSSATDLAGRAWNYTYAPATGAAITYDVFSGRVDASLHDGGASAYAGTAAGAEYRDVAGVGGTDSRFTHALDSLTSPEGEVTRFERGANGRLSTITYPDGGERTITYDSHAHPDLITLPQGTTIDVDYDAIGRETSRTASTGESRGLTYGPGDRIETMTDVTGTTTYHYDGPGRFSGMTYPHGGSVRYDRDKLGRTIEVSVRTSASAAALATHYDYDENGNLAQVTDPHGGITGFVYDAVDRLEQRVLPNGVVTSYSYDDRDRIRSIVHRNASNAVLSSVVYERSGSGEPVKITREDGTYVRIEYDAALRIEEESQYDANDVLVATTIYGYDLDGNRTSKTTLTGAESYSYDSGFKLTGITGTNGTEVYAHDDGGRLVNITRGGVSQTLEYDSRDHVTRVLQDGVEKVRYSFDGEGRRVATSDGADVKRFLVAPNMGDGFESPQAVTDGDGNLVAAFVFAGRDTPFMKITPAGVEYFLQDSVGSVLGKINGGGFATANIRYDGFGNIISATGPASNVDPLVGSEPRFHGMALDANTGLYFVRARTYDPRTGRFVSRDPVNGVPTAPETQHPYVFAFGNPHAWSDPSGLFGIAEVGAVGAIASALSSIAVASLSWAIPKDTVADQRIRYDGGLRGSLTWQWKIDGQWVTVASWYANSGGSLNDDAAIGPLDKSSPQITSGQYTTSARGFDIKGGIDGTVAEDLFSAWGPFAYRLEPFGPTREAIRKDGNEAGWQRTGGYWIHGGRVPGTHGCIEMRDYNPDQENIREFDVLMRTFLRPGQSIVVCVNNSEGICE